MTLTTAVLRRHGVLELEAQMALKLARPRVCELFDKLSDSHIQRQTCSFAPAQRLVAIAMSDKDGSHCPMRCSRSVASSRPVEWTQWPRAFRNGRSCPIEGREHHHGCKLGRHSNAANEGVSTVIPPTGQ